MLKVFPRHILLEEQAWLRSRIPQHKEALEIIETNKLIRDAIIEEARSQVILNNDEKSRIK